MGTSSNAAAGRCYRMATAGGDSKVRVSLLYKLLRRNHQPYRCISGELEAGADEDQLWMVHPNVPPANLAAQAAATGQEFPHHPPRTEYLATLSKHTSPVNVVRFSPNGHTLASAGDGESRLSASPMRSRIDVQMATSFFGSNQTDLPRHLAKRRMMRKRSIGVCKR